MIAVALWRGGVWERRVNREELVSEVGHTVTPGENHAILGDRILRTRRIEFESSRVGGSGQRAARARLPQTARQRSRRRPTARSSRWRLERRHPTTALVRTDRAVELSKLTRELQPDASGYAYLLMLAPDPREAAGKARRTIVRAGEPARWRACRHTDRGSCGRSRDHPHPARLRGHERLEDSGRCTARNERRNEIRSCWRTRGRSRGLDV